MAKTPPQLETLLPLSINRDEEIDLSPVDGKAARVKFNNSPLGYLGYGALIPNRVAQALIDAGYHSRGAEVEALRFALSEAVRMYGSDGGPWNVPSHPGSWIAQARAALQEVEADGEEV